MKERTSYQGLCLLHPTSITYPDSTVDGGLQPLPQAIDFWGPLVPADGPPGFDAQRFHHWALEVPPQAAREKASAAPWVTFDHAVWWCLLAKNHSMKSCQVMIVAMKVSPNARPLDVPLCSTCFFHAVLVDIDLHQAKLRTDASSAQCNRHVFEPLPSVLCYTIFTYTYIII